jgi:hypothetical protein
MVYLHTLSSQQSLRPLLWSCADDDITLQHLRADSCDRTDGARQITKLCFSCSGPRHSFWPATNVACVDRNTSINNAETCGCFPLILFRQQGILSQHVVCNAHHWLTPFWSAAAVVLSVRNFYNFVHNCRELQIYITKYLTFLQLLLVKEKIWGITFWATLVTESMSWRKRFVVEAQEFWAPY